MKDLLEISCGLDIHKDIIVACILSGPIGKTTVSEIHEFSTLASGLAELRDWILSSDCRHVAMESTGVYWIALYEVLEDASTGLSLLVVNARHMKNIPSKKKDMRDAQWIATLLRAGLLNASFIPENLSGNSAILHVTIKASYMASLPRKTLLKISSRVPAFYFYLRHLRHHWQGDYPAPHGAWLH